MEENKKNKEKWEAIKEIIEMVCVTAFAIVLALAIFVW